MVWTLQRWTRNLFEIRMQKTQTKNYDGLHWWPWNESEMRRRERVKLQKPRDDRLMRVHHHISLLLVMHRCEISHSCDAVYIWWDNSSLSCVFRLSTKNGKYMTMIFVRCSFINIYWQKLSLTFLSASN